jgi:hypothetical protein
MVWFCCFSRKFALSIPFLTKFSVHVIKSLSFVIGKAMVLRSGWSRTCLSIASNQFLVLYIASTRGSNYVHCSLSLSVWSLCCASHLCCHIDRTACHMDFIMLIEVCSPFCGVISSKCLTHSNVHLPVRIWFQPIDSCSLISCPGLLLCGRVWWWLCWRCRWSVLNRVYGEDIHLCSRWCLVVRFVVFQQHWGLLSIFPLILGRSESDVVFRLHVYTVGIFDCLYVAVSPGGRWRATIHGWAVWWFSLGLL